MLESLEKLKRKDFHPGYRGEPTLEMVAAAIQSEVDERYMELPLDADGVPIHVGDKLKGVYKTFDVCGISEHYAYHDYGRHWDDVRECHHVKPRTVEDVLEDFIKAYAEWDENLRVDRMELRKDLFAKYAAELQMRGDAE